MSSWSTDTDVDPLEEHRQELTNTVAGRGNESRGRGEDGEEAEKLLEHLDGLFEDTKECMGEEGKRRPPRTSAYTTNGDRLQEIFMIH